MGSGNAELCSDATCGVESSTGGGVDDDARSPGVCKVGLVVSWMMAHSYHVFYPLSQILVLLLDPYLHENKNIIQYILIGN